MRVMSYVQGEWVEGTSSPTELYHAVTGEKVAEVRSGGLDYEGMLEYARQVGGPALRSMTFHERARMLKAVAAYLSERKESFYELSAATGATRADSWIDIDGGFGTFFTYASKGRRELPDLPFYVDGGPELISKNGTFVGRHICVPLEGVAVHINAFNFPVWGMLEKLAPTLLAGVPAIVKPATLTCYLAERVFRAIVESGLVPKGAIQLLCGSTGDLLERLGCQDAVAFTGSAETGRRLRQLPNIVSESVRFNMEADSLNCCILAPDATPGTEEYELFLREVVREMTSKAGQKCTAIRRTLVPESLFEDVAKALKARLSEVKVGNPVVDGVRMGPLAGKDQVEEVRSNVAKLRVGAEVLVGGDENFEVVGADPAKGAFFPITLLVSGDPWRTEPHEIEAFGPVNTLMPYSSLEEAVELARRGRGSLCGSLFTFSDEIARAVVLGVAAYHGRIMVVNRQCARESTGHGSPLPHLVHGGPGRAGGGEEMGGVRGVLHYMQRTALQGAPQTIARVTEEWITGAATRSDRVHPFRKYFEELEIGETLVTHRRTVTEADIVNFAAVSGDHFYAHTDELAARESIFGRRVAHGYFVLAAAAGLFVDPAPGPVLANYGLENLRFTKPVYAGDTIQVQLTCKSKTVKETPPDGVPQGVVAWDVRVTNQDHELVATYTILTLVRRKPSESSKSGD
ncbi:MAG TPA: phenylacetic acid degradation bifunctional protein PaaZ [Gemmatimonadaceae bacterium]|nr:phenylacetic acid degradation bifunctional protein PaaZ [Gemmatimonadaceae bacterium]